MKTVIVAHRNVMGALMIIVGIVATPLLSAEEPPDPVTAVLESLGKKLVDQDWAPVVSKLTPPMYDELYARAQRLSAADRGNLISYIVSSYPGVMEQRETGVTTRYIIRYVVRHLSDSDSSVRNEASYVLYTVVTDVYLRDFAPQVLEAVRKHPDIRRAARIVGRLGSASAKELLLTPDVVEKMTRQEPIQEGFREIIERENRERRYDIEAALARMGDRDLEWKFICEFRNRPKSDRSETAILIEYLGYIGSPGCVVELARVFLESPYRPRLNVMPVWMQVAKALHNAMPFEPTFWSVYRGGGNRPDYEKVKKWIEEYLGLEQAEKKEPR